MKPIRNRRSADRMTEIRYVTVEGQAYRVTISDEEEALSAAHAAGRAIIGVINPHIPNQNLHPAVYAVEDIGDVDLEMLERVVRRHAGLPWIIARSERLEIREFRMEDLSAVPTAEEDSYGSEIFGDKDKLEAYIRDQYGFYEYGIWAVTERSSDKLVGKAGIADFCGEEGLRGLELGYHIFTPWRRKGYGREACREILNYTVSRFDDPVYTRIDASNEASIRLAEELGFHPIVQKYNGEVQCLYRYERRRSSVKKLDSPE